MTGTTRHALLRAFQSEAWAVLPTTLAAMEARIMQLPAGTVEGPLAVLEAIAPPQPQAAMGGSGSQFAIIPVQGLITRRASFWQALFGGASTEDVGNQVRAAAADPNVATIVLAVDSPGGTVDGVPELAQVIRQARDSKPVVAMADTLMASAAYWIGSQATEIIAAPSAMLGSIGVISTHMDVSRAMDQAGITVTHVSAGKYKTEGTPYEPLGEEAQAAMQALVDEFYAMFVADVAKGRGVPVADVRGGFGEGRVVLAREAVQLGMADRIGGMADATRRRVRAEGGRTNESYRALARTIMT